MDGESDDLVADQIFKIIQDNFQDAPQTERLLKMSIRTLIADTEQHTIPGIRPLSVDDGNGKQKTVYSETFLRNLPKRTADIKITDNVDGGEKAHQAVVVEVPPLDRYLPNGEVATFGDTDKIAEAS